MADPELLKLQALEEDAWARLQQDYWKRLFHYARNWLGDHQAAEDVVQETFLGAVRGIAGFDPRYTVEQFLFGIAHNRIVDHLRRHRPSTRPNATEDEAGAPLGMDVLARDEQTASQVYRRRETASRQREVLIEILRALVAEIWESGDLIKLKVLESIFVLGRRNKDIWQDFGLQDEKAVAGIKFRAIQRLKDLARQRDADHTLFPGLWKSKWDA
jgi:RNA polymerase sigma factor (sigma-70 family)